MAREPASVCRGPLRGRLAEETPGAGLREAPVGVQPRVVCVSDEAVLTNTDIANAQMVPGASPEQLGIEVHLSEGGSARMREMTRLHIGPPVALMLDGLVVVAPAVRSEIGEVGLLTGDFSRAEALRIVREILPQ